MLLKSLVFVSLYFNQTIFTLSKYLNSTINSVDKLISKIQIEGD
jgi:hypothetical protein